MEKSLIELAGEFQRKLYFGKHGLNKRKKNKMTRCAICNREMESPTWEEGPKYCWKCSDKHEIGMEQWV